MDKFIDQPATVVDGMLPGLGLVLGDYVDIVGHTVIRKGVQD